MCMTKTIYKLFAKGYFIELFTIALMLYVDWISRVGAFKRASFFVGGCGIRTPHGKPLKMGDGREGPKTPHKRIFDF